MIAVDHDADLAERGNIGFGQLRVGGRYQDQRCLAGPGGDEGQNFIGCLLLGMNQDRVGAGFGICQTAPDGFFLTLSGDQRFHPCHHHKILVAAGIDGGFHLALKFFDPHQFLATIGAQAGVFRKGLVFHHDGRGAGCFVLRNDVADVDGIAKAGIDIGDQRH